MSAKLITEKYDLPAYWASYLINGDASGISDSDKQNCDAWLEHKKLPAPCDCSEESHFGRFEGLGCDLLEYTFLLNA